MPTQSNPSQKPTGKSGNSQRTMIQLAIAAVIVAVALFLIIPRVQAGIRSSQIESLVDVDFKSKKVRFADMSTIEKEIKDSRAITVVFAVPSGEKYDRVISLFEDEATMQTFSRSLTIFPIVYDATDIEKKYNIKKDEITAIFFEGGEEKNRYVVEDSLDIPTGLIFKLNELPLAAVETSETQTEVPAEGTPTPTADSGTIDAGTTDSVQNEEQLHQEKLQTIQ